MAIPAIRSPGMEAKTATLPGLERADNGVRPAKLFIGGITRHTTTKQLRDHFSRYGRVLDCVAMRQPDGRPRGFGYVTLDSPAAADRCLAEPQVIDGRVVDMKRAVPEGAGVGGSPVMHGDMHMGVRTPHSPVYGWPESPSSVYSTTAGAGGAFPEVDALWNWGSAAPPLRKSSGEVLDCVELLSRHGRSLPGLQATSPGELLSSTPAVCNVGTLSANAPEFVPAAQVPPPPPPPPSQNEPAVVLNLLSPVPDVPRRTPLGELTNITNIMNGNNIMNGSKNNKDVIKPDVIKPPISALRGSVNIFAGSENGPAPTINAQSLLRLQENQEETKRDSVLSKSDASDEGSSFDNADEEMPSPLSQGGCPHSGLLGPLPSIGSADHARGTCKRCNFFPKGRCQNGYNCTFCHYPHDKRKPSRQEKRDRRAVHLCQQDSTEGGVLAMSEKLASSLLLGEENLVPDEEINQRTLAYPMLPGMPPVGSVKLPDPLVLPGLEHVRDRSDVPAFPCLPPGLPPPKCGLELWQSDEEVGALLPFGTMPSPMASPTAQPAPVLATVPMGPKTPQSVAASPTAASAAAQDSQAEPALLLSTVKEMCTIGTQTIEDLDYAPCTTRSQQESDGEDQGIYCEALDKELESSSAETCHTREEFLRVRGAMEAIGVLRAKTVTNRS